MGTLLQDFAPLSTYAQEQVTDLYDGTSQALTQKRSEIQFSAVHASPELIQSLWAGYLHLL